MEQKDLRVSIRRELKKGPTKRLRKQGKIPAVVYGHGRPMAIAVDAKEFYQNFSNIQSNVLYNIDVEGDHRDVLVKDVQRDTIADTIKHIDFFEIERGKTLKTTVPLRIEGSAVGVKEGGLLEEHLHALEVECMPKDIPAYIPVDVSLLNIGDSLHVSDLEAPQGVKFLSNEGITVVGITVVKTVETEETAEEDLVSETEAEEAEE